MKKADITWETIVKLIIGLIIFTLLIIMYFLLKDRLINLFYVVKTSLGFRGT